MRIMKGRSKDPTYHVIQDVRRDGKRSTEIVKNLGSASEICAKYHVKDADAWANEYIRNLRDTEKEKKHKILVPFCNDIQIEKDVQNSYNVGYLFLQKIYHQLGIPSICRKIKKEKHFDYDLDAILTRLVYGRVLFPASKYSSFEQAKKLIELSCL